MRHPAFIEQTHGLFQIIVTGDAEAEMVKAHPVGVEPVI